MRLAFERAFLPTGVASDVVIEVSDAGRIASVGRRQADDTTPVIGGLALPGMPNIHGHAFQRAFAGQTEVAGEGADSFWTWRDAMYRFVDRLTPDQVSAIAAFGYLEMLRAGYTGIAEFHYLHHQPDGDPYPDRAAMSEATRSAARLVGIRQLLLPSLYQTAGFGGLPPGSAQRRFVNGVTQFLRLYDHLADEKDPRLTTGIALHSLRAVPMPILIEVVQTVRAHSAAVPIHIHIAEQQQEVDDCLRHTGRRPVELLLDTGLVDNSWCLVHATHLSPAELEAIARTQAVVGLCLTTEANLGDGRFPLDALLESGGHFGIGSDSHVSIDPREELRLAEYNLRLWRQRRVVVRMPRERHCGTLLYRLAYSGGARAMGQQVPGLAVGADADLVVVNTARACDAGVADESAIDQHIFAPRPEAICHVMVGGSWVIENGRHARQQEIEDAYKAAAGALRHS